MHCRIVGIEFRRRPLESLLDHLIGRHIVAEQGGGRCRHLALPVGSGLAARHRRRRADADHIVAAGSESAASDEQRDIGALPAPIGVELIEDQKPEPAGGSHQLAILAARQQELQHHVVGEKDVRRIGPDLSPLGLPLLPGVTREAHRRFAVARREELGELLVLAVRQGVHGIDDNRLYSVPRPAPQHMIDDGNDIRQALAGTGAAGQDIRLSRPGLADGLRLVRIERELPAGGVGVRLVQPEDPGALFMEHPFRDQIVDRSPGFEGRVQLKERFRPEGAGVELRIDLAPNSRIGNFDETAGVVGIIRHKAVPERENVHDPYRLPAATAGSAGASIAGARAVAFASNPAHRPASTPQAASFFRKNVTLRRAAAKPGA